MAFMVSKSRLPGEDSETVNTSKTHQYQGNSVQGEKKQHPLLHCWAKFQGEERLAIVYYER